MGLERNYQFQEAIKNQAILDSRQVGLENQEIRVKRKDLRLEKSQFKRKKRANKPLLFFNLIPNIVFGCFIGFFFNLIILALILISIFTQGESYQLFFYSWLGFTTFLLSFLIYRHRYFELLKIPSYKSFLVSRNKLAWWIFWTVNAWMLSCWAGMVVIGSFGGLSLHFWNNKHVLALTNNAELTKIAGIILWVTHCLLLGVLSVSYRKFIQFFRLCRVKLRERRVQLQQFKLKAEKEVSAHVI